MRLKSTRAKLKSCVKKVVKDDFQGDFFKDFYFAQGDYNESVSGPSEIKDTSTGECHGK